MHGLKSAILAIFQKSADFQMMFFRTNLALFVLLNDLGSTSLFVAAAIDLQLFYPAFDLARAHQ